MSLHLPPPANFEHQEGDNSDSATSDSNDDDQNWDDWISDSLIQRSCKSLFDEKVLSSVEDALKYDKETHGFDLNETCSRLGQKNLDFHVTRPNSCQMQRLIFMDEYA